MRATRFLLPGLLLGVSATGLAQTTADVPPAPRFYVGLGLYNSQYHTLRLESDAYRDVPVQLTLGYQWRPRLAVQASVAYSGLSYSYGGSFFDVRTGQYYNPYGGTNQRRATSTALLARYTLTRQLRHRVQFDLLGGGTLERTAYQYTGFRTDSV
ncbi:MAG: hypothetical protein ACRYFX_23225 [Janthinobacterium lividum]